MVTENDLQLKNGRSVNLKNLKKIFFMSQQQLAVYSKH